MTTRQLLTYGFADWSKINTDMTIDSIRAKDSVVPRLSEKAAEMSIARPEEVSEKNA